MNLRWKLENSFLLRKFVVFVIIIGMVLLARGSPPGVCRLHNKYLQFLVPFGRVGMSDDWQYSIIKSFFFGEVSRHFREERSEELWCWRLNAFSSFSSSSSTRFSQFSIPLSVETGKNFSTFPTFVQRQTSTTLALSHLVKRWRGGKYFMTNNKIIAREHWGAGREQRDNSASDDDATNGWKTAIFYVFYSFSSRWLCPLFCVTTVFGLPRCFCDVCCS